MQDLVGFRFGCSDCTRSHSMNDVEGGHRTFAAFRTNGSYAQYSELNKAARTTQSRFSFSLRHMMERSVKPYPKVWRSTLICPKC